MAEPVFRTERLYFGDAYLRAFEAHVVAIRQIEGRHAVALDRTAFYPTGGGQPHDTGVLGGARVLDVTTSGESELIWHILDEPARSDLVEGEIDWSRRFDHMQQHTGQHVLSQAFIGAAGAETVAFHLGASASTIDLDRSDLKAEDVAAAEAAANAVVDSALRVTTSFVEAGELPRIPVRRAQEAARLRQPRGGDPLRVVEVQGYDWSACGGTHASDTAQIGLIKVTDLERRGAELRVTFLCGGRARADYGRLQSLVAGLAAGLTIGQDELPPALDRLQAENKALRKDLAELERTWADGLAARLLSEARAAGTWRVVTVLLDCPMERAKLVAQSLRAHPGTIVLIGAPRESERPQLVFTRADDVSVDVGAILRNAASAAGGKGGGRPDWAQGGVPAAEALPVALDLALGQLLARCGVPEPPDALRR